jgi:hypothetical protein
MFTAGGGAMHRKIDSNAGPWTVYASVMRWLEEDSSKPTSRVKKAALELVQGAASDVEKARRIHDLVQKTHREFLRRAKPRDGNRPFYTSPSLDAALDLGKNLHPDLRSSDFTYLALSLYRAAGLQAELILLPDRRVARLDPKMASHAFLQDTCVALLIDGAWHFSMVDTKTPLRFGELPWHNQGHGGLLARANRQDFIEVPLTPVDESTINNFGVFTLNEEGRLTGEFRRVLLGHPALALREALINQDNEHQHSLLKESFDDDLKGAELSVTKIANLEEPEKPLEITFKLEWPGYGVLTSDRLILPPSIFRSRAPSPFPAAGRQNAVRMPFKWQETDRLIIRVPAGFEPESMSAPSSYPGETLGFNVRYTYDAAKRHIHVLRTFQSAVMTVSANDYPHLKTWYDATVASDQHELVFIKAAGIAAVPANAP